MIKLRIDVFREALNIWNRQVTEDLQELLQKKKRLEAFIEQMKYPSGQSMWESEVESLESEEQNKLVSLLIDGIELSSKEFWDLDFIGQAEEILEYMRGGE